MNQTGEIFDSPTGWVRDHIRQYIESNGERGHRWRGLPTLLLTTRGRKTGQLRRTALIYGQADGKYLLVASNGGADQHPLWYLNLCANPTVEIQVGPDKFTGQARTANAAEKLALWPVMSKIFPTYDAYAKQAGKAGREIPLVIVEPIPQA
jgi:deazaflavin-dependent oxidoreductase (nitroreductase family)